MNSSNLIEEVLNVIEDPNVRQMKEVLVYTKYCLWLSVNQVVSSSYNKYLKELLDEEKNNEDYLTEGLSYIENNNKKDLLNLVKGKLYISDKLIEELNLEENFGIKQFLIEQTFINLFSISIGINNYGFYSVGLDIAKRDESPLYQIQYFTTSYNSNSRLSVADNYKIKDEYLTLLAADPVVDVRLKVLDNPNITNELISILSVDNCELVRKKAIDRYQNTKKKVD